MGRGYSGFFSGTWGAIESNGANDSKKEVKNGENKSEDLIKQIAQKVSPIEINVNNMIEKYPVTEYGYFGEPGKNSKVRVIYSDNPLETSKDFYDAISIGGMQQDLANGLGQKRILLDGTVITYREKSKSGSPAVDINISSPGKIKGQKIHFEQGDKK